MPGPFQATRVSEHVYWVGGIDWSSRDFHGYSTPRGTTYNAYLILADTVTLVDTVKAQYRDELMYRIASVIDPTEISLIVSNHAEQDHSGSLVPVARIVKPDRIVASPMGVKALARHTHGAVEVDTVRDGETLSLGNMDLSFVETRMLHWPDSMFSYLGADEILFTQDAFGMHLASSERFDDELDPVILESEAAKYFANILLPYSKLIGKLLERVGQLNLPLKMVAPDHGPIWRTRFDWIAGLYDKWWRQEPTLKAVVTYDTMWQSTDLLARSIAGGLTAGGASPKLHQLRASHRSDVAADMLQSGALVVGSPTINNQMFPTVADLLSYVNGLKPTNLIGAAFGSYGWSGEGVKMVNDTLREMKVELISEPLRVQFVPDAEELARAWALGEAIAAELKTRVA
ncbi:FprA family A-type flavoprotein [bacterium]|nr:FprA family A-type flavoprotein [bacterium]